MPGTSTAPLALSENLEADAKLYPAHLLTNQLPR